MQFLALIAVFLSAKFANSRALRWVDILTSKEQTCVYALCTDNGNTTTSSTVGFFADRTVCLDYLTKQIYLQCPKMHWEWQVGLIFSVVSNKKNGINTGLFNTASYMHSFISCPHGLCSSIRVWGAKRHIKCNCLMWIVVYFSCFGVCLAYYEVCWYNCNNKECSHISLTNISKKTIFFYAKKWKWWPVVSVLLAGDDVMCAIKRAWSIKEDLDDCKMWCKKLHTIFYSKVDFMQSNGNFFNNNVDTQVFKHVCWREHNFSKAGGVHF